MLDRRTFLATSLAGVAAPAGADYGLALAEAYGGRVDPLEAHRLAVGEAKALQVRADRLLRGQGLSRGGVGQRLRRTG